MKIEVNKLYKTRSGLKARIYAVDGSGDTIVHGAVLHHIGWVSSRWDRDGKYLTYRDNDLDLIDIWTEPKPKLKAWLCSASSINKGVYYTNFSDEAPSDDVRWIRAEWLDQP